jgi:hypothetical protein
MSLHAFSETDQADQPNPYQAPLSNTAERKGTDFCSNSAKRLYIAWAVVFALNLIVPLLCGWGMTQPSGRLGMLVAGILLLASGYWVCVSARHIGFALVNGGVAMALFQAFPILQLIAGSLGIELAEAIGLEVAAIFNGITTAAGGFVVTITTGGLLMAAALVVGLALRALRAAFR